VLLLGQNIEVFLHVNKVSNQIEIQSAVTKSALIPR